METLMEARRLIAKELEKITADYVEAATLCGTAMQKVAELKEKIKEYGGKLPPINMDGTPRKPRTKKVTDTTDSTDAQHDGGDDTGEDEEVLAA